MEIITNSELQKHIGKVAKASENQSFMVTTRSRPKMILVPYFLDGMDIIDDYMEEYFLAKNAKKLQDEAQQSLASGLSDLLV